MTSELIVIAGVNICYCLFTRWWKIRMQIDHRFISIDRSVIYSYLFRYSIKVMDWGNSLGCTCICIVDCNLRQFKLRAEGKGLSSKLLDCWNVPRIKENGTTLLDLQIAAYMQNVCG